MDAGAEQPYVRDMPEDGARRESAGTPDGEDTPDLSFPRVLDGETTFPARERDRLRDAVGWSRLLSDLAVLNSRAVLSGGRFVARRTGSHGDGFQADTREVRITEHLEGHIAKWLRGP